MCGIGGFAGTGNIGDFRTLSAMIERLRHRGPDGEGMALLTDQGWREIGPPVERGKVGLAHTRLSIVDLSDRGRQPMAFGSGRLRVVYNGEIYNFRELRMELARRDMRFSSQSDTEVLLAMIASLGIEKTLRDINGMFAFAAWDDETSAMYLARDRAGKKPLYYVLRPDGSLFFASELKALVAAGVIDTDDLDLAALHQVWTFGYTVGERTIYRQARRLLPGHYAVWRDGRFQTREYWDCPFGRHRPDGRKLDDLADELEEILSDAVRIRLLADVPVGLFLSGGIDSSLVGAIASRKAGVATKAYTIGFPDSRFDETRYASSVARVLGLDHETLVVRDDMRSSCEQIARHFDEPFGDSSAIPTFFVSGLARTKVKAVLGGDGGDELFAGYDSYEEGLRLWGSRRQRRMFSRRASLSGLIWDARRKAAIEAHPLTMWEATLGPFRRRRLFSKRAMGAVRMRDVYSNRQRWYERVAGADFLSQMQYVNFKTYLPDDILVKVDRMSMAHGLECRSPLLDHRVIEFAARLPPQARISENGERKVVLKHLLRRYLPPDLVDRPKKGFSIPWAEWWSDTDNLELRRRWRLACREWFEPDAADWLFASRGDSADMWHWRAFSTLVFMERLR